MNIQDCSTNELLQELIARVAEQDRKIALAELSSDFVPISKMAEAIRDAREQQQIGTQADLADLADVSRTLVAGLESVKGKQSGRLDLTLRVLSALGLTLWVGPKNG